MAMQKFQPGFRLSSLDIVILIVGGVASACATTVDRGLGVAIAFVILHFFLFCNVLRMSRPFELLWAGLFAGLAGMVITRNLLSWPVAYSISTGATVILGLIETHRPSYHGVGWRKLNPRLPEWWRSGGVRTASR